MTALVVAMQNMTLIFRDRPKIMEPQNLRFWHIELKKVFRNSGTSVGYNFWSEANNKRPCHSSTPELGVELGAPRPKFDCERKHGFN